MGFRVWSGQSRVVDCKGPGVRQNEDIEGRVHELVRKAPRLRDAWTELVDYARDCEGDPFWRSLAEIDVDSNLEHLRAWLRGTLEREPPPDGIRAYWFGLCNPLGDDGEATSDFYVAGSMEFDREDPDWACDPAYWPSDGYAGCGVCRRIYAASYVKGGPAVRGEYFCLWHSCLVIAQLCREYGSLLRGNAAERHVAVGFDDGDQVVLGTLKASGFHSPRY